MFSTCSCLLPSWPSTLLYCFPYLRPHPFLLLVLTSCPQLLKLLQPPFYLVNKHSTSYGLQYSGLLTDSLSTLHSWPHGCLWFLSTLWVQASPAVFDLCCCLTHAVWNYSSCLMVFASTVVFWLPVLLCFLNPHSIIDWPLLLVLLISLGLITYSHTGNRGGGGAGKLIRRRWGLGLISSYKSK